MRPVLRVLPVVFAVAASSVAQERAPSPPPVLVDKVVATVNDSAILHSELLTLTEGTIRTKEATGRRLRPEEQQRIYEDELRKRIDEHTWAQAAKTFGYWPPEQVEAWFQRELERDEQNQVRDLGSYQAFSRELQNANKTWPTYVREQRVDKMADIAKSLSIGRRMQQQSNLYITPRMMRETYEEAKRLFVHEAQANVALVKFTGDDRLTNAEKAAAMWRSEDLSSRALAQRFPGAIGIDTMAAAALVPELASFALAGPVDRVSDPIEANREVLIAKIVLFAPARNGKFEDEDVQEQLRRLCERGVQDVFTQQALDRARQRSEVWPARLGR